jgi:integrase
LLAKIAPAAAGVCAGRWANIRSLALKALKSAGLRAMPGRYRESYTPEWEALRARLPDRRFQSGLSRFMSYCTTNSISPPLVTAATFSRFGAELDAHSLSRDPGGIHRDTCRLWNMAVTTIPGWPPLLAEVPVRRCDFAMEIGAFPAPFGEDLERFLTQAADSDVFSDTYRKPVRPLTIRNRRQNIMMAATALVRSDFPISQITGLEVLVRIENATAALRFLYERAGVKTTGHIYQIATLLKTIAQHYAKLDHEAIERLRARCRALKPPTMGLTEKNKRFLRQFADEEKLAALVTLPRRIIGAVERGSLVRRRDAVRVELAAAVAIELSFPIRVDNLTGLRLDRHIQFVGDVVYFSIPAEDTKNGNALEAELPPHRALLLRIYIETVRPMLIGGSTPWLFPGEGGERRRSGGFGTQISVFIAKETGLAMTVHQFRHLAAKLYLDRHSEDLETVRRLLGHKTTTTTQRFYRELESIVATKRYGEFLERLLAETETKSLSKPHRRRGE